MLLLPGGYYNLFVLVLLSLFANDMEGNVIVAVVNFVDSRKHGV